MFRRQIPSSFLLILGLAMVACPTQTDAQDNSPTMKTFVFKKTPQGKLEIDVHFPPDWTAKDKRPAVVFFFGGGWKGGHRKQFTTQATYLAKRGMIAARADYRIKGKHKTMPDKCVLDCKSAVRWLRENAGKLGIDPTKVAAGGGSAGGHTAAATFTTKGLEGEDEDTSISSQPNLLVLFNPALNTSEFGDRMGGKEMAVKLSPNNNLSKDVPPTIILFGTNDKLLASAKEFQEKAADLGIRSKLYIAKGQKHGFFNRSPWMEATLLEVDRFLVANGYLTGNATIEPKKGVMMKLAHETK